jgi:SAM-dependent methyltransferase
MSRTPEKPRAPHGPAKASAWVKRFAGLLPPVGEVLDLACGGGRHSRFFLEMDRKVVAIDRDISAVAELENRAEIILADLEDGSPFPLAGRRFAAVVVTNYLYRPLLPSLIDAVAPEGLLIYDTFAKGNEHFGRPANPDHLLRPGELLEAVRGRLRVLAYEDLIVEKPWPAAVQRICARREPDQDAAL